MKHHIDRMAIALLPVLAGLTVVFLVLPLLVAGAMSFDARGYLGPFPPPALSLRWYENFFSDSYFLRGLRTTVLLAICTTAISVTVGVLTAIVVDRYRFRGREALMAFFMSPLVVPPVVIGFALLFFLSQIGVFEGFVRLLAGHVIITVPYAIRATLGSLVGIRRSLTEAALILGANERQAFWEVTFPLARTGIIVGAVFAFAVSMDDVAVSIFLTDSTTYTLPVALISVMRANFDLTIAAVAVMLVVFTVVLIVCLDRLVGLDRIIGQGIYRS